MGLVSNSLLQRQGPGLESLSNLGEAKGSGRTEAGTQVLIKQHTLYYLTSEDIKKEKHVKRLNERNMFLFKRMLDDCMKKLSLTLPLLKIKKLN